MTDNKKDMRDTYTIYDDQTIGKVQIADEVVAIIAGLAATEVEGVASMAGNPRRPAQSGWRDGGDPVQKQE